MGRSIAIELSRKGANVVIVARNIEKLQAACEAIRVHPLPNNGGEDIEIY